ncbi:MAG: hypothetical protein ACI4RI_05095, partial [Ruminococcus sp.]
MKKGLFFLFIILFIFTGCSQELTVHKSFSAGVYISNENINVRGNFVRKENSNLSLTVTSPKELSGYPNWLDKKEQEREFIEAEKNLAESIVPEQAEEEYDYQYHLGDKVYIGADEYEILSIGDFNVVLYDYQYPLFNRE